MSSSPVSKMSTAWQVLGSKSAASAKEPTGTVGKEMSTRLDFEEQLAVQLDAAQEALKHSHEQVLLFVSRRLSLDIEFSTQVGESKVKPLGTDHEIPELLPVAPAPPTAAPPWISPPGEVLHEEEMDRGRENGQTKFESEYGTISIQNAASMDAHDTEREGKLSHVMVAAATRAAQEDHHVYKAPGNSAVIQNSASMASISGANFAAVGSLACPPFANTNSGAGPQRGSYMTFEPNGSLEVQKQMSNRGSCDAQIEHGKFTPLPQWSKQKSVPTTKPTKKKRNFSLIRAATHNFLQEDEQMSHKRYLSQNEICQRVIVNPNEAKRVVWDLFSIFLVAYDMVVIPLQLFEPPDSGFSLAMSWVTRVFWTLDVLYSSVTGYLNSDGTIEMRASRVVLRYARTWFLVDFLLVFFDWWEILWSGGSDFGYFRVGKASRTFRIIRMARLLRVVRIRRVLQQLAERIQSEWLIIMADLVKILLAILGLAHVIACLWWGIGTSKGGGWVEDAGLAASQNGDAQDLGYRYSTSLHWSVSQFTGGMDEVRPHTVLERVYAIIVFLMGFMMAALFVSSLTSSMTQLHILTSHQSRQLAVLRRYLSHNGISDRLALRVQRNAQHAMAEKQRHMPESGVELLIMVSDALRVELHFELYAPTLRLHPFFQEYIEECPQVMCKVCHIATSISLESAGDVLFHAGEILHKPKMYIVVEGTLEYVPIVGKCTTLGAGAWMAEASLWTTWIHRGVMTATNDCRLLCVDAKEFQTIASRFEHLNFDPKDYAVDFVRRLNLQADANDLFGMDLDMQQQVDGSVQWLSTFNRFKLKGRRAKLLNGT